jgi:hypothetical protein
MSKLPKNQQSNDKNKLYKLLEFLEWIRRGIIVPITVIRFIIWLISEF